MHFVDIAPLITVLIASLAGSAHCVAMCGGFTTLTTGDTPTTTLRRAASYHVGRLVTYTAAGLGASAINLAFPPYLLGGSLVVLGMLMLFNRNPIPTPVHRGMSGLYRRFIRVFPRESSLFPAAIGLGSTLLPCGWLYVYVGVAAAGSMPVATMLFFWLGTLPALTMWSAASGWILKATGRFFPQLRAALLVVVGVLALMQHTDLSSALGFSPTSALHCHH